MILLKEVKKNKYKCEFSTDYHQAVFFFFFELAVIVANVAKAETEKDDSLSLVEYESEILNHIAIVLSHVKECE